MLADKESRDTRSGTEWKLNPELFDCIVTLWGTVSVDLFHEEPKPNNPIKKMIDGC